MSLGYSKSNEKSIITNINKGVFMHIKNFKLYEKNSLVGFGDILLGNSMVLRKCSFFKKDERFWASMPSEKVEKGGKTEYFPLISFQDEERKKEFNKLLAPVIRKAYEESKQKPLSSDGLPF